MLSSKKKKPLVSVITTVWNKIDTIEQSIQSVINQTYPHIEHIIIDGSSTDGTSEIIAKYSNHIAYYLREKDEGIYHGMNRGIAAAQGDYILFLNADDYYLPETIKTLVDYREATGADVVSAQVFDVNADDCVVGRSNYRQYNSTTYLGMVFCHNLMLVPKYLYEDLGYHDVSLKIISDWDYSNKLWRHNIKCAIMRLPLMYMRNTGASMTNWDERIANVRRILRNEFPFLKTETLDEISDPRKWSSQTCQALLTDYANQIEFCKIVYDYGVRRGLIFPSKDNVNKARALSNPMLSIVIPAYNCAKTIKRAVTSALDIKKYPFEIICVNDGSNDNTLEALREYEKSYANIRVIDLKYNVGVSSARNEGIKNAKGEYVFFLDADDTIFPKGVTTAIETALSDNADIVIGSYDTNLNGKILEATKFSPAKEFRGVRFNDISDYFFPATYPGEQSKRMVGEGFYSCIYKTELVKKYNFRETLKYGEDSLFLITFLCQAKRISWIGCKTYEIIKTEGSAMTQISEKRAVDTAKWRLWASQILLANETENLSRFVSLKYWNPTYGDMLKDVELSEEAASEILEITNEIKTLFDEKPSFLTNDVETYLRSKISKKNITSAKFEPRKKLKVNIVIGIDSGGAANGSWRRMNALRSLGHDAKIYTAIKNTSRDHIYELSGPTKKRDVFRKEIMTKLWKQTECSSKELFSNIGTCLDLRQNNHILDCDIIHLHWITGLINLENFKILGTKPIVWTLADINSLTGGCHYSAGCTEFTKECNPCHFFKEKSDFPTQIWRQKKDMYAHLPNVTIVCPSKWMADQVKKSSLLGNRPIRIIPNAMPTDVFFPRNKLAARIKLGLPINKKILLFGADDIANHRKGGDILLSALDIIARSGKEDYFVAIFGGCEMDIPFPTKSFGHVVKPANLAEIYSAADVFIFPSREDNAPLTVGESLLCGTPVVSTNVGYVNEILIENENGVLCPDFSPETLATKINIAMEHFTVTKNTIKQQNIVSSYVSKFHNPVVAAQRHVALYEEILSELDQK